MKDLAPHDRPREKLERAGAASLGDNELLSLLIGHGTTGDSALTIANRLLASCQGAHGLTRSKPSELAQIGSSPSVLPENTVLVGIRNLDQREKEQIRAAGVHVFTMKDVDRDGIAKVAEQALALASRNTGGIHVSFDMDVCDPTVAPGVGTPVKGGIDYREAHLIMEMVDDSGQLIALDLVEVNPTLDIRNTTAEFGTELALSALGKGIL
jgi:arginase